MSFRGDTDETSEHRNSHNGAALFLVSLGQSYFVCFCVRLSAVETGNVSDRQMAYLCRKGLDSFFAFEGKFQILNFLFYLYYNNRK